MLVLERGCVWRGTRILGLGVPCVSHLLAAVSDSLPVTVGVCACVRVCMCVTCTCVMGPKYRSKGIVIEYIHIMRLRGRHCGEK